MRKQLDVIYVMKHQIEGQLLHTAKVVNGMLELVRDPKRASLQTITIIVYKEARLGSRTSSSMPLTTFRRMKQLFVDMVIHHEEVVDLTAHVLIL